MLRLLGICELKCNHPSHSQLQHMVITIHRSNCYGLHVHEIPTINQSRCNVATVANNCCHKTTDPTRQQLSLILSIRFRFSIVGNYE